MNTREATPKQWPLQVRPACSVTRFEPHPIPEETLEWILEMGCQTVSSWHLQPWQFIVVREEGARAELLRRCAEPGPAASAPVLLVGLGNPNAWKQAPERLAELIRTGALAPGQDAQHLERIQRQWSAGESARIFAIAQTYAALQQVSLAALACDVCSWWLQEFDGAEVARLLHVPRHLCVAGVVALGYCTEQLPLPEVSLARLVFAEAFGLSWERRQGRKK